MSWLNWVDPVSGAILAGAVIPPLILLYFLKLRRRTQPIGSTLLWKRSIEDLRANAPFQKLRRSLLLLLQLIALAMLALAIMQPQWRAGNRTGGSVIILIDNSASMNASDVEPAGRSRLDDAKEKARNLVESYQSSGLFGGTADEIMVIGFNARAEVYCAFTDSRQQLIDAIDAIESTHLPTRIDEALKLARAHTTVVDPENPGLVLTGRAVTFELFTDGRIADWERNVSKGERLRYYPIGGDAPDNIAFGSIAAERPFDNPDALEVFASLANFNVAEVTCRVQMSVGGNVEAGWIRDVVVEPAVTDESTGRLEPGRANVIFGPFEQRRGAVIELANLREDDLALDNMVWIVTPDPQNLQVAIVEPRVSLTSDSVAGMNMLRRLDRLTAAQFEAAADDGTIARYDVIVLDGFDPASIPPGRYVSLGAALPLEPFAVGESVESLAIADWDREHPVMRYVNLNNLIISRMTPLAEPDRVKAIAEAGAGRVVAPAIVEWSDNTRHVLHCVFKPIDTNWFWHPSFVIFMVNAVEYLGTLGEAAADRAIAPGEPIVTSLPSATQNIAMHVPGEAPTPIATADPNAIAWARTNVSGVYELTWTPNAEGDVGARRFAVSHLDAEESNIHTVKELAWGGEPVAGQGDAGGLQTPLWPWAIALCLLVLMFEWWVYHRRTHL